jgi:phage gpG-like protein
MPSIAVRLIADDLAKLNKRIAKLLHDAVDLEPVMAEAAQYMRRSTVNRILRTRASPEGERWQALSDVTIALKGHDRPLFESGELVAGIYVQEVTPEGFVLAADSDHASYMQKGVAVVKGAFKSKRPMPQIPARPFMGFSDENVRRISKMIRDHLAEEQ